MFVFPGALGDFLLALPTLRLLRLRHAPRSTTLVTSDALVPLARLAGVADDYARVDGAASAALFTDGVLPAWLAGRPVVYSWLGASDPALRARVASVAVHAVFARVERGDGPVHAAVAYARAVGLADRPAALRAAATLTPAPAARAARLLDGPPLLVVHAGAGAPRKRWAAAGFAAVASRWRARGGAVAELVGPAEEGGVLPDATPVAGWPLADVAALIARAACWVGNDSGPSHLAGAVGVPGAVVFGPTSAARWRPFAGRLVAVRSAASAPDGIPIDALPVARVLRACRRARRAASRLTRGRGEVTVPRSHEFFAAPALTPRK